VAWRCGHGHGTDEDASEHPVVHFTFNKEDIKAVKRLTGRRLISLDDYFSHFIPRISGGKQGTTPVHMLSHRECGHLSCTDLMEPKEITTYWPMTLTISHDIDASTSGSSISYGKTFDIDNRGYRYVEYKRVGRVIHHATQQHYTAQVQIGEDVYEYDDMKNMGRLMKSTNPNLLDEPGNGTVYYVYVRTSDQSVV